MVRNLIFNVNTFNEEVNTLKKDDDFKIRRKNFLTPYV